MKNFTFKALLTSENFLTVLNQYFSNSPLGALRWTADFRQYLRTKKSAQT